MIAFLFAALTGTTPTEEPIDLAFGVYQTDKPTVVYAKFVPILDALGDRLDEILDHRVDVRIEVFRTYEGGIDALVNGEVDFVRFGPASYVLAERRDPDIELLAMEEVGGKRTFPGVIAVRADSSLKTLTDLRGRSFAFGDENSTIGRFLAQSEMLDHGIRAQDLLHFEYLGRHDLVATRVRIGDFDAGALKIGSFEKANERRELRVLHSFDNVTKPWLARSGLNARLCDALQDALVSLRDERILADFKVSGFARADRKEYDPIRRAMRSAEKWAQTDG